MRFRTCPAPSWAQCPLQSTGLNCKYGADICSQIKRAPLIAQFRRQQAIHGSECAGGEPFNSRLLQRAIGTVFEFT